MKNWPLKSRHTSAVLFLSLMVIITGCDCTHKNTKTALDSLPGKWRLQSESQDDRTFIEEWRETNDTTYSGRAYVLNNGTGDTIITEILNIFFRENNWVLVAEPTGQQRTEFRMTQLTPEYFRFTNPQHDFPKYIQYRFHTPDSLVAEIGDSTTSRFFPMKRTSKKK